MKTSQADRSELTQAVVTDQLRTLRVREGGVVLVHSSFRATRPVQGGVLGLIAAMRQALGPDGTLVMPSETADDDEIFDPATTPPAAALGAVPGLFWRLPGVQRSRHFAAFAAIGPEAERIVSAPLTLPPHAPGSPISVVHQLDGQVLLLGVEHDCNSMMHLAEIVGGAPYRVPRHYTELRDGRPARVDYGENDHCCQRFVLAGEWLKAEGLQSEGRVGYAEARLAYARDIVHLVTQRVAADPLLFLHPSGTGCVECEAARASIAV
jgi:aminoglycoside N3'-acetyltransferase